MATLDDNFAEYFTLAQAEALTARESHIVDLRYGFVNGEPHILEQVGEALVNNALNRYEESNYTRLSQKIKGPIYLKLTK